MPYMWPARVGSRCPPLRSALLMTASNTAIRRKLGRRPACAAARRGRRRRRCRSTAGPFPARAARRGRSSAGRSASRWRPTPRRRRPRARPACRRESPTAAARRRPACRRRRRRRRRSDDRAVQGRVRRVDQPAFDGQLAVGQQRQRVVDRQLAGRRQLLGCAHRRSVSAVSRPSGEPR